MTVDPIELTRQLIRFDTTNPPGAEAACVDYIAKLLADAGLETRILALDPARPNLIARFPGRGAAPPLLLHGHVDVVPTAGQHWSRPPFAADLVEGEVWGRGSVDMKGGVAMMLSALLRIRAEGLEPAGDVLLAVVCDEEAGSRAGAEYLVGHHREVFDGVACAVGEDGGASADLGGQVRFHPIVVAEKRACWVRVTLHGPGGHGSRVAPPASPVWQLHQLLTAIEGGGLGVILTSTVRRMLTELASAPTPYAEPLSRLRDNPADLAVLADLPERDALYLRSVLQHSVNATVIRAGTSTNILPSEVAVELDARLLPGLMDSAGFIAELRSLTGPSADIELLVEGEPLPEPEFGPFYDLLTSVLRRADPDGIPVPMLTTASTDARLFAKLGIACYGWLPMKFPAGLNYRDLLHAADERIPVQALEFGTRCFYDLLRRYE